MKAVALSKRTGNFHPYPAENEVTGCTQWVTFKPFATSLSPKDLEIYLAYFFIPDRGMRSKELIIFILASAQKEELEQML